MKLKIHKDLDKFIDYYNILLIQYNQKPITTIEDKIIYLNNNNYLNFLVSFNR